jgi:Ser/Thr protein kinase RdoA (MazF antagonist)
MSEAFACVPEAQRDMVAAAVSAAFGRVGVRLEPVRGGASSAMAYSVDVGPERYLMRIEGPRTPLRNPHQYTCMRIAADAGVAPPMVHADDEAGIAIMRFLPQRPLAAYPGGPVVLAAALGELTGRLQSTPPFPFLVGYFDVIGHLLGVARDRFAPGLLEPHLEAFSQIREAYPWDPDALVSSHNDPNPSNILFDGERLWLIDWETSYRNDPLVDVAILASNHGATPDLEAAMLQAWLGRAPDRSLKARLAVMRLVTALYYAALIFTVTTPPRGTPYASLDVADAAAFRAAAEAGQLSTMGADAMPILGLVYLNGFIAGLATPEFRDALAVVQGG